MDTWTSPISFTCPSSHGTQYTKSHQTEHITQHSKHMWIRQPRPLHLPANQVNRVTAHVTQSHTTHHIAQSIEHRAHIWIHEPRLCHVPANHVLAHVTQSHTKQNTARSTQDTAHLWILDPCPYYLTTNRVRAHVTQGQRRSRVIKVYACTHIYTYGGDSRETKVYYTHVNIHITYV